METRKGIDQTDKKNGRKQRRAHRREKRSAFLSRMVDEFKKIIVIVAFVFVTVFLVWEHVIYQSGESVPSAVPVALISGFFSSVVAYCIASAKEKDSLNKSGLRKTSNGMIEKIEKTENVVARIVTSTSEEVTDGDSDEKEID